MGQWWLTNAPEIVPGTADCRGPHHPIGLRLLAIDSAGFAELLRDWDGRTFAISGLLAIIAAILSFGCHDQRGSGWRDRRVNSCIE